MGVVVLWQGFYILNPYISSNPDRTKMSVSQKVHEGHEEKKKCLFAWIIFVLFVFFVVNTISYWVLLRPHQGRQIHHAVGVSGFVVVPG